MRKKKATRFVPGVELGPCLISEYNTSQYQQLGSLNTLFCPSLSTPAVYILGLLDCLQLSWTYGYQIQYPRTVSGSSVTTINLIGWWWPCADLTSRLASDREPVCDLVDQLFDCPGCSCKGRNKSPKLMSRMCIIIPLHALYSALSAKISMAGSIRVPST